MNIKKIFSGYYNMFQKGRYSWASRGDIPWCEDGGMRIDCVSIVAKHEKGTVVIRQVRDTIDDEIWEFPAGKVDRGESAIQAARRELFEETGLTLLPGALQLNWAFPSAGMIDECHTIVVGHCTGEITNEHNEGDEQIEVFLMSDEELINLKKGYENCSDCISAGLLHHIVGLHFQRLLNSFNYVDGE